MPEYSVEKPMAGATTAYSGRKSIVKTNEPGMAERIKSGQRRSTVCLTMLTSNSILRPDTAEHV